jgi:hypothetical protein
MRSVIFYWWTQEYENAEAFVVSGMLEATLSVVSILNVSSVVFGTVKVDVIEGHYNDVTHLYSLALVQQGT